jgi:hypothetical protein
MIYLKTTAFILSVINIILVSILIPMLIVVASATTQKPEVKTIQVMEEPILAELKKVNEPTIQDPKEIISIYIEEICKRYKNVDPNLVKSIVYHESRYSPLARNGSCLGLMQVSTRWHANRAEKLGVTDFYDPYSNILIGVDYLSELFEDYKDPALVLMLYNMRHDDAINLYNKGLISGYAKSVLAKAGDYKKGD